MAKYMTPDFDVTVYEIKEQITLDVGGNVEGDDLDLGGLSNMGWNGPAVVE